MIFFLGEYGKKNPVILTIQIYFAEKEQIYLKEPF